jgi:GH15 family glucan-1,4-alpha-glucosidase
LLGEQPLDLARRHPGGQPPAAQYEGSDVADAAVLLMPLVKLISPADPEWLSTLGALTASLVSDSLVYRYDLRASPEGRGWAFEKMLPHANHVGVYAEQISGAGQRQGNFPQALTHPALISAVFNLDRALGA